MFMQDEEEFVTAPKPPNVEVTDISTTEIQDNIANQNRELEEVISVGIKVYEANCIKCHKADLKGAENWKTDRDDDGHRLAPPLNGYGHSWHHSPEQIFNTIRYGLVYVDPNYEGKMNANDKLTDEEIWSVIEYMYSVWPEDVQSKYNELFLSD